ncbi:MAG: sulfatase [Chitinophagaceae bacterium]
MRCNNLMFPLPTGLQWNRLLLVGICLVIVACKSVSPLGKRAAGFNVLFIAVDDLNNDLSVYGHPVVKTPNLERLAKRGVTFSRAYCQYPLCNPSRSSLLTGLYPDQLKIYDLVTSIRQTVPEVVTLPQLFKNSGYYTARVGKIFHYGVPKEIGTNGLDDSLSWNHRVNPIGRDKEEEAKITNLVPSRSLGSTLAYLTAGGDDSEQTDGKVAAEAIRILEQKRNQSLFLAVGFYRPHSPFVAPKKYFEQYSIEQIALPVEPANDLADIPEAALNVKPANWGLDANKQKEAIRAYYAAISFMDAQVGLLLDALDRTDSWKNTIVVLWSDHGYNLGQHGQWMKQSLFEASARVPLLIAAPGGSRGMTCSRTVGLIDLYPTLTDLCDLKPPTGLAGRSLKPLLQNAQADWKHPVITQVLRGKIMGYSIRTEKWRYTEWDEGRAGVELYNEDLDKGEITNLAGKPITAAIQSELAVLLKESKQPQR